MVIIAIPLLVLAFLGIHRHYRKIARRLRAGTAAVRSAGIPRNQVLDRRRHRRRRGRDRALVRAADRGTATCAQCTCRAAAPTRDPAPLVQARRPGATPRDARPGGRANRRRARGALEAPSRRTRRRHRRHPGAVPPPLPARRRPPNVVPTQAPPPLGAGSRRRRRPRDQRQLQPRRAARRPR